MNLAMVIKETKDNFLARRTKQELAVLSWANKLTQVNPELLKDVKLPTELTLKAFVPELYVDKPDPEKCKMQYQELDKVVNQVKQIIIQHNKREADRTLQGLGYDLETMTTADLIRVNKMLQENFIAQRAKCEMELQSFQNNFAKLDPVLFKELNLPDTFSLKVLVPELYRENPNKEICREQLESLTKLVNDVNSVIQRYVEEAEKCILEYREKTLVV